MAETARRNLAENSCSSAASCACSSSIERFRPRTEVANGRSRSDRLLAYSFCSRNRRNRSFWLRFCFDRERTRNRSRITTSDWRHHLRWLDYWRFSLGGDGFNWFFCLRLVQTQRDKLIPRFSSPKKSHNSCVLVLTPEVFVSCRLKHNSHVLSKRTRLRLMS